MLSAALSASVRKLLIFHHLGTSGWHSYVHQLLCNYSYYLIHSLSLALWAVLLSLPACTTHPQHTSTPTTSLIKTVLSSSGSSLPSPSQQWLRNARQECCPLQGAREGGDGYHLKTMSLCSQPAAVTQGHAWVCAAARPMPPRLLPHLAPTRPGSASSKALYHHVMFLQNQGWEHPVNQCQAPL